MKHGKRPTVAQMRILESFHLDPQLWLVCQDTLTELVIEHRYFGTFRVIPKRRDER